MVRVCGAAAGQLIRNDMQRKRGEVAAAATMGVVTKEMASGAFLWRTVHGHECLKMVKWEGRRRLGGPGDDEFVVTGGSLFQGQRVYILRHGFFDNRSNPGSLCYEVKTVRCGVLGIIHCSYIDSVSLNSIIKTPTTASGSSAGIVRSASYTPDCVPARPRAAATRVKSAMLEVPAKMAAAAKAQSAVKFQAATKAQAAVKGPAGSTLAAGPRLKHVEANNHGARPVSVTLSALASNHRGVSKKVCLRNSVNRAKQCVHERRKTRCPICMQKTKGGTGSLCEHLKQKGWCMECKNKGKKYFGDRCSKND